MRRLLGLPKEVLHVEMTGFEYYVIGPYQILMLVSRMYDNLSWTLLGAFLVFICDV